VRMPTAKSQRSIWVDHRQRTAGYICGVVSRIRTNTLYREPLSFTSDLAVLDPVEGEIAFQSRNLFLTFLIIDRDIFPDPRGT
jgi:hypothetical protein